jgi:hypothetical protein
MEKAMTFPRPPDWKETGVQRNGLRATQFRDSLDSLQKVVQRPA